MYTLIRMYICWFTYIYIYYIYKVSFQRVELDWGWSGNSRVQIADGLHAQHSRGIRATGCTARRYPWAAWAEAAKCLHWPAITRRRDSHIQDFKGRRSRAIQGHFAEIFLSSHSFFIFIHLWLSKEDRFPRLSPSPLCPSKDLGNRRLLWHGSRTSNFISILSQGLRVAPPEAPVSGYMFGKGIYFADVYSKSRAYCAGGNMEATYMLLCDVSLGNPYPTHQAHYMEAPQAGTNSTWGVGRSHPSWEKASYEPGGAQVPGPMKEGQGSCLGHSEFIVYDPAQVRSFAPAKVRKVFILSADIWWYLLQKIVELTKTLMRLHQWCFCLTILNSDLIPPGMRYLVELNNFESPSEKHAREVAEAAARGETHPAKKPRMPEPQDGVNLKSLRYSPLILFGC